MEWAAKRTSNKIIKTCPHCNRRGPKEQVEGPLGFNVGSLAVLVLVIMMTPCTCGIALLCIPLFCFQPTQHAYCERCEESFPV